jgi:hypothetical protein
MRGELKKRAAETGTSIGFISEGMVAPTREYKHAPAAVDLNDD